MSRPTSRIVMLVCVLFVMAALYLLYFFDLTAAGMIGPDEPRYASIGREMARSGDWITPRLWGERWFEKPPLLYWMTATSFRLGLSEDLAPRLPVALASAAFLMFYFWILRHEFGSRPAWYASAILATTGGWLTYSHVGVTDIPLATAYSAAMLLALPWISAQRDTRFLAAAGGLLGVAVLAKGLAPIVLALPLAWFARDRRRSAALWKPVLAFLIVTVPWYALCTYRNGSEFPRTFFWVHHFERFTSGSLQHVQPVWFYAPILPELLFPWTPVMVALFQRNIYSDRRTQFLLAGTAFTLVFFSASANKLPGYILPSIPPLAAVMGISLASMRRAGPLLFCSAALLSLTPVIADTFPASLLVWFPGMPISFTFDPLGPVMPTLMALIPLGAAGACAWYLDRIGRRDAAMILVVILAVASFVYLKARTLPAIDQVASARLFWRQLSVPPDSLCAGPMHRNWRYGLNYYSVAPLPDCKTMPKPFALVQKGPRPAVHRNVGQTIAFSRLSVRRPQNQ